jgi:hypothetical protein
MLIWLLIATVSLKCFLKPFKAFYLQLKRGKREGIYPKTSYRRTIVQYLASKGQIISKANYGILNSSKKGTKKFVFTTMRLVFVRFLEEIEDTQKTFQNYLTVNKLPC